MCTCANFDRNLIPSSPTENRHHPLSKSTDIIGHLMCPFRAFSTDFAVYRSPASSHGRPISWSPTGNPAGKYLASLYGIDYKIKGENKSRQLWYTSCKAQLSANVHLQDTSWYTWHTPLNHIWLHVVSKWRGLHLAMATQATQRLEIF